MNNIKKGFTATVMAAMAICLFPFQMALADPGSEMGCIAREQGSKRFVRSDQLDRKNIMESMQAQRLQGARTADPCLSGQLKNIPAAAYAKLAEKYPDKYQPLEEPGKIGSSLEKSAGGSAKHKAPQYSYNGFLQAMPPEILLFAPVSLKNDDRVYGIAFTEFFDGPPFFTAYAAVFKDEAVTILKNSKGFNVNVANARGTLGGYIITDSENFFTQAALFYGKKIHLIPRLPGEISSQVILLNDPGVAIISSLDENFNERLALYKNGRVTLLDFGPDIPPVSVSGMNNQGIIVGITSIDGRVDRGIRFDPRTKVVTILEPQPTEPHSWAVGINNRGDVLGYSFIGGGIERIGVWDAKGKFHTYFVEGTPEFPTISNRLKFNDNNTIVITLVTNPPNERDNSYLVPKPGVRLNIADLVTGMPPDLSFPFSFLQGINNHGNILSFEFLLERIGQGDRKSVV